MLGEASVMGDKCSVKRSVIGRHCRIGSNVKVRFVNSYQICSFRWSFSLGFVFDCR